MESCVPSRAEVFQNNHSKKEFKSQKRNCNRSGKNNCNRGKYADQFIETNAINKRWADYLKELHYHKIMKDPEIITQSEEERSGRWRYMWETSREEDEIQTIRNTESGKVIGLEDSSAELWKTVTNTFNISHNIFNVRQDNKPWLSWWRILLNKHKPHLDIALKANVGFKSGRSRFESNMEEAS